MRGPWEYISWKRFPNSAAGFIGGSPAAEVPCRAVWSPEGAKDRSPGRKPWGKAHPGRRGDHPSPARAGEGKGEREYLFTRGLRWATLCCPPRWAGPVQTLTAP